MFTPIVQLAARTQNAEPQLLANSGQLKHRTPLQFLRRDGVGWNLAEGRRCTMIHPKRGVPRIGTFVSLTHLSAMQCLRYFHTGRDYVPGVVLSTLTNH
jgi:hypothetical protein